MEDDLIGSFFEEIRELDSGVSVENGQNLESTAPPVAEIPAAAPVQVVPKVIAKAAEIRPKDNSVHAIYSYEVDKPSSSGADNAHASETSTHPSYYAAVSVPIVNTYSVSYTAPPPPNPIPQPVVPRQNKVFARTAAGEVWVDDTLNDWPANDFRIFVGDLAKEVATEHLVAQFQHYKSFAKAKVMRSKQDNKAKGYGFVSFLDPMDCAKAIREQNGKYLLSRPMKITKSTWNDRDLKEVKKKENKKRKLQASLGLA